MFQEKIPNILRRTLFENLYAVYVLKEERSSADLEFYIIQGSRAQRVCRLVAIRVLCYAPPVFKSERR